MLPTPGAEGKAAAQPAYDVAVKMLLLGDSGAGKSALLVRFMEDQFFPSQNSTLGIDFKVKLVDMAGKRVRLQIWDTAGQERFRSIATSYFRGVKAFLLVYDVTSRKSFENVARWIHEIKEKATENYKIMVIANKIDLPRVVMTSEGQDFAKRVEGLYIETSAKESINIAEAFFAITNDTLYSPISFTSNTNEPQVDLVKPPKNKKKMCHI